MTDQHSHPPHARLPVDAAPLLVRSFVHDQVTGVRHAVASCVAASGLSGQRLDDFVLAVNELITNAVQHGGGQGWLRLWRTGRSLICEVSDHGPGIDAERLGTWTRPALDSAGGWGLWLIKQLSDDMMVRTGPGGTTVQIRSTIDRVPAGREQ